LGGVQTTALAAVSPTMDEIKVWERTPFPVAPLLEFSSHRTSIKYIAGNWFSNNVFVFVKEDPVIISKKQHSAAWRSY
jgi:hypothetical protein